MITFEHRGNFKNLERFLKNNKDFGSIRKVLQSYGQRGVDALSSLTPVDTGKTAASWSYEIERKRSSISITWKNSSVDDKTQIPIVVLLVYGHATGTGGYVQGRDFIHPAIAPIFDEIADEAWKEVTK